MSPQWDQGLQWAKESVGSGPTQLKLCQFPIRCSHEEEAASAIRPVYQLERRSVRTDDPTAQGGALRHLDQGGLGGLQKIKSSQHNLEVVVCGGKDLHCYTAIQMTTF